MNMLKSKLETFVVNAAGGFFVSFLTNRRVSACRPVQRIWKPRRAILRNIGAQNGFSRTPEVDKVGAAAFAGHLPGGYHWLHERGHSLLECRPARRPKRRGTAIAAGLRRAAQAGRGQDGQGTARSHARRHRPGARGLPSARRRPGLRRSPPLLSRRRRSDASNPHRQSPPSPSGATWRRGRMRRVYPLSEAVLRRRCRGTAGRVAGLG